MVRRIRNGVAVIMATAAGLTGFAVFAQAEISQTEPSVIVLNQKIKQKIVMIDYAYLPAKGYVAVYPSNAKGKPSGDPIGSINMDAGSHVRFAVTLKEAPKIGDTLWVSLYRDADNTPDFDPGKGDVAFWPKEQLPSPHAFKVQ